jgi:phage gp46-like protein
MFGENQENQGKPPKPVGPKAFLLRKATDLNFIHPTQSNYEEHPLNNIMKKERRTRVKVKA